MADSPSGRPASSGKSENEEDLFFPASDDEDGPVSATNVASSGHTFVNSRQSKAADIDNDSSDIPLFASQNSDIIAIDPPPVTASVAQQLSTPKSSLIVPSSSVAGPSQTRKRPTPSRNNSTASSSHSRSRIPPHFTGGYLGEFVCEGWSLSKGKGYCSPGSKIVFERPKVKLDNDDKRMAERHEKKAGPARLVSGKMVHAKGKAGKQMTLGSMMKKSSPAPATAGKKTDKKVVDQIIRFRNERGFEVGRLSVNEAGFLVHLLDTDIISLKGHVIDCPAVLSTGATILLNVKVYLTRKAFEVVEKQERKEEGTFWQEQKETTAEEAMRHRKDALGALFSIKPIRSNALLLAQKKNGRAEIDEKSLGHFSDQKGLNQNVPRRSVSPSKREKSPEKKGGIKSKRENGQDQQEGEEDEEGEESGDEAEKLDEEQMNEIDSIYRKLMTRAQQGDNKLDETDPPPSFLYTLRPYQKQALTWMNARETGDKSVREESLHPLWEEYAFRKDRAENEPIEIEDDDDYIEPSRKFYWNPYSGELSITFPTSQTKARGGILADAMGMGKTCMMSSLIHLNQDAGPEDIPSSPAKVEAETEDVESDEQLAKRPKFKQVTLSNQWRPIVTSSAATTDPNTDIGASSKPRPRATLVVCPVSLASQWHEELGKMSDKGTINSAVWYGNDRVDVERLLMQEGPKRVDVIVTSYGTLASEFGKWRKNKDKPNYEGGSIYDLAFVLAADDTDEFLRIVLDEAHNIKNRTALVSKACYELKGQRRWALTGTPIVNRLEDLYSLLHFLRLEPWGHYSFFRSFVTIPFLNQDPKALNVVQYILESCLLRREKTMRDKDGRLIVDLPPKTVDLQVLDFSRPERQIYKHLEERAKRRFIQLDAEGRAMSNYTSILAMLMKLRQCVDHPLLVLSKVTEEDGADDKLLDADATSGEDGQNGSSTGSLREMIAKYASAGKERIEVKGDADQEGGAADTSADGKEAYALKVLKEIEDADGTSECMICTSEIFDEVLLPCYHRGCQDCIVNWIGSCEDQNKAAMCPMCDKGPVGMTDLRSVQRRRKRVNPITGAYVDGGLGAGNEQESAVSIGQVDLVSSTKLRALVRRLEAVRAEEPTFKALVFSQFTSFLDLIEDTLNKAGIRWLRFDGSMSQSQRAATVESFGKPTKEPLILLISLKAGGVGLNLTMANYVFMMDTWWNEAIEHQAIDRVHRLGQNKPVFVIRYVIKGTVEKRILKIQRSKTALVNASLAGGAQKDKAASLADIKKIFGLDADDSEDEGL